LACPPQARLGWARANPSEGWPHPSKARRGSAFPRLSEATLAWVRVGLSRSNLGKDDPSQVLARAPLARAQPSLANGKQDQPILPWLVADHHIKPGANDRQKVEEDQKEKKKEKKLGKMIKKI